MTEGRTSRTDKAAPDADKPHVFVELDLPQVAEAVSPGGTRGVFVPPKMGAIKSQVCGLCRKPRMDRLHIEGEAEADAESPNWG
jgi:hypothetical protein